MHRMKTDQPKSSRVDRHRARTTAAGSKRVEITVPAADALLVKTVAGVLRAGGEQAERLRGSLELHLQAPVAQSGAELVAFLRDSPLVDGAFKTARDRDQGREVTFE